MTGSLGDWVALAVAVGGAFATIAGLWIRPLQQRVTLLEKAVEALLMHAANADMHVSQHWRAELTNKFAEMGQRFDKLETLIIESLLKKD